MIVSLNVKNFAIIDNILIDFKKGMTALTGSTGAGKSLIIDAIGLLFGDRASNDLVRHDETKAIIEGVFDYYPEEVNNLLKANDIDDNEGLLIIKREIYANGKSIAKINGETVSLSLLTDLSYLLGDIHTQFDAMKLVNPKNYFSFIDNNNIANLIIEYKKSLKEYNDINKEYLEIKNNIDINNQKLDYLKYQMQELKNANLDIDEEDNLNEKIHSLTNHEKIFDNYKEFLSLVKDSDLLDNLYNAINSLDKNVKYNKDLTNKIETLNEAYYNILDINDEISSIVNHDDFDINQLDEYNERISTYNSLKRKYKMTTKELIEYFNTLSLEIDKIENIDIYLDEVEKKKRISYDNTYNIAKEISNLRKERIVAIEKELLTNLQDLSLKNTELKISLIEKDIFLPNGINEIDFLVSFNKGEKVKSLSKVASGGELSRFMLALKAISCDLVKDKTFIFDEIDTGVNGEVAYKIGERLNKISKQNQVICVTHLPQVAGISNHHLLISKEALNNSKTVTKIEELDYDGKVLAIASMLSDGNVTDATIVLAKEILDKNL